MVVVSVASCRDPQGTSISSVGRYVSRRLGLDGIYMWIMALPTRIIRSIYPRFENKFQRLCLHFINYPHRCSSWLFSCPCCSSCRHSCRSIDRFVCWSVGWSISVVVADLINIRFPICQMISILKQQSLFACVSSSYHPIPSMYLSIWPATALWYRAFIDKNRTDLIVNR